VLFGLWYIVGLRHIELGRENIPKEPCIIVSNHQSLWETLALAAIFPSAAFVAKREISQFPIVGWYVTNYPMIMIDRAGRGQAIRKLIQQSRAALAEGRSVVLFPEGTRKSVSDRVSFRKGIEFLYAELQCPFLPVALNSGVFWGPDRKFKYKGTITISYLPSITPNLSMEQFKMVAETAIQNEKDRLLKELDIDPWIDAIG
jgi:1-acyl-sn-glycerol-3-phosphate acyltransferase